jgi:hypothetical protein
MIVVTDPYEVDVPEQAVRALVDAHRRAVQAGYPIVMVRDGNLVREQGGKSTVLKQLPPRMRVQSARTLGKT